MSKIEGMRSLFPPIVFLLGICVGNAYAYERSDAFIIKLHSRYAKVVAPAKYHPRTNIIVENKRLIPLMGRIERASGEVIRYISVKSSSRVSVMPNLRPKETLFFVAMSPPFQRLELKLGARSYEIPAQK